MMSSCFLRGLLLGLSALSNPDLVVRGVSFGDRGLAFVRGLELPERKVMRPPLLVLMSLLVVRESGNLTGLVPCTGEPVRLWVGVRRREAERVLICEVRAPARVKVDEQECWVGVCRSREDGDFECGRE